MTPHNPSPRRPEIPSPEELAKLPPDGGPHWNRLVFEKSPYLLQHAANPVNWYPWGEEAFRKAAEEDKPVFLSVGYATCHWCHVMEHESFEDEEIGRMMDEAFVCIKVDREERPDIDHVYMNVTQAMTGSGGWPMTVLMTAEKKPFFSGTYFPKESRYGRPGMADLIRHISSLWKDERQKALDAADYIAEQMSKLSITVAGEDLSQQTLDRAFEMYRHTFDRHNGGFGDRPKFPVPHNLSFLLRYYERSGNDEALNMVTKTLERMRLGGIFDHVGFGFHRYSTDGEWLVPHFEKMLYDQALLAMAYTEAWQITRRDSFRETAEQIFQYVFRDMTSPEGGFYSAEDADSEGEEGKFYIWSAEDVRKVLGEEEGEFITKLFCFEEEGNFREESTGQLLGVNIPHLEQELESEAATRGIDAARLRGRVESARLSLFDEREKRPRPLRDDKILTDWNGLLIAALAKAAMAFEDEQYLHAARDAADFLLDKLRTPEGRLLKRYRQGEAGLPAHLEDYAFLAWGLLELYEAGFETRYLYAAAELSEKMIEHFWDEKGKGFYHTASDGEKLFLRGKEAYDGATPSGNSVAALVLLKLNRMTAQEHFAQYARDIFRAFSSTVERSPMNFAQMLIALDLDIGPSMEIVLAGAPDSAELKEMANFARREFLPRTVLVHRPPELDAKLIELAPILESNIAIDGKGTAYICREFACGNPVTSFPEFQARLREALKTPSPAPP